ncbi:MAG: antibiotic resistance protein MarC [Thermoproteus sp. JCHS_4]|nr:MAG: antibiotic resistance protein MarC [Thermoproteus sp. JCHS_4]
MEPFSLADALIGAAQLYAIIDPLGAVPLLAVIPNYEKLYRRFLKLVAATVPALLLLFALAGPYIFYVFNININGFRAAGGILLLVIAVDILREGAPRTMGIDPEDYVVVPIITPMLVGPGAITSVMVMATYYNPFSLVLAIAVASALTYATMRYSLLLIKVVGSNTLKIFSRFFSLIVAAWAVQLIADGFLGLIKA